MDGVFIKQKSALLFNILGLVSGIFLLLFFGFFLCIGEFATLDERIAAWFFVCFGLFVAVLCAVSLYVNRKVFLHIEENRISAFCHFGLSLECSLSDIESVSYGGTGLSIRLKNGKHHNMMNLENAYEIGRYIQKRIYVKPEAFPPKEELLTAIPPLRKKRNREGILSVVCFLLIFPGIFLTAALTGWRDLQEFTALDWTVFSVMAGLGALTLAAFCILLRKWLLDMEALEMLRRILYQVILQTEPLLPGNPVRLFVDDEIHPSVRLTVFGYPNSDELYFTVEQINRHLALECFYTSKIYADFDALAPELEGMTEIALP